MLYILQYLAIFAAFALPFLIGGLVRFGSSGETKKRTLCIVLLVVALVILALTVVAALGAPTSAG